MPYKDPVMERAYQAAAYSEKYHTRPGFKKAEAKRKAKWFSQPEVKARRAEALRQWRIRTGRVKNPYGSRNPEMQRSAPPSRQRN